MTQSSSSSSSSSALTLLPAIESFIQRWIGEGIERGRVDVFDELVDPSCEIAPIKQRARAVHDAFRAIASSVSDIVIDREASRIAWRFTLVGTHFAPFMGIEATGKRVTIHGMNIQRLAPSAGELRVVEHFTMIDRMGVRDQLLG